MISTATKLSSNTQVGLRGRKEKIKDELQKQKVEKLKNSKTKDG